MPFFERDGVSLYHEEHGDGDPVLLLAPGGMHSRVGAWGNAPWNPIERLRDNHRLIAMDQRNGGRSTAPIRRDDGWERYTHDQLALLDHLGVERFAIVGMCIGGPYIMRLIKAAPQRIRAAVMLQPIGLENNREAFYALFDGWADALRGRHPEADAATWAAFRETMFGGDFMFGATRDDVAACSTPLLVLMGDDAYHPASISREIVRLAPRGRLIEQWKGPDQVEAADRAIRTFLTAHP